MTGTGPWKAGAHRGGRDPAARLPGRTGAAGWRRPAAASDPQPANACLGPRGALPRGRGPGPQAQPSPQSPPGSFRRTVPGPGRPAPLRRRSSTPWCPGFSTERKTLRPGLGHSRRLVRGTHPALSLLRLRTRVSALLKLPSQPSGGGSILVPQFSFNWRCFTVRVCLCSASRVFLCLHL